MSTHFRLARVIPRAPASVAPTGGADLFANAGVITLPSGLTTFTEAFGTNAALGMEGSEPQPTANTSGKSAWWKFTPAADCLVSIDTIGSSGDTELALYTGAAVGSLTKVASDADSGGSTRSLIMAQAVTAGVTYHIQVAANASATMNYTLNLRVYDTSNVNDLFANARVAVIPTTGATYADGWFYNGAAGTEGSEPSPTGFSSGRSMWWKYVPTASGSANFNTTTTRATGAGGNIDTEIALYTGASLAGLTKVASDSDSGGGNTSAFTFSVTAGVTYYLQVRSFNAVAMAYAVSITGPAT